MPELVKRWIVGSAAGPYFLLLNMLMVRLATGIRHVRHDQKEPDPTQSDPGRSCFMLSSVFNASGRC